MDAPGELHDIICRTSVCRLILGNAAHRMTNVCVTGQVASSLGSPGNRKAPEQTPTLFKAGSCTGAENCCVRGNDNTEPA